MPTIVEVNTTQNPAFFTIPDASSSSTLAQDYANGAVAADQTLLIQAGDGGPVIFKANGAGTGSLLQAQTSAGGAILNIPDNDTIAITSQEVDGAGAKGFAFDTANTISTGVVAQFSNGGTQELAIASGGILYGRNTTIGYIQIGSQAHGSLDILWGSDATTYSYVYLTATTVNVDFGNTGTGYTLSTSKIIPVTDNAKTLGDATHRFSTVFTPIVQDSTTVTLKSTASNGATAVAAIVDTSSAWTDAAARLLSLKTNAVEKLAVFPTGTGSKMGVGSNAALTLDDTTGAQMQYGNVRFTAGATTITMSDATGSIVMVGGTATATVFGFIPDTDGTRNLGSSTAHWLAFAAWYDTKMGAQLTAANTITPTTGCHHVTGNTVIKTIATTNVPGSANANFIMIADTNTVNWDATGNIAVAGAVTNTGRTIIFTYDFTAAKWYPSAVA